MIDVKLTSKNEVINELKERFPLLEKYCANSLHTYKLKENQKVELARLLQEKYKEITIEFKDILLNKDGEIIMESDADDGVLESEMSYHILKNFLLASLYQKWGKRSMEQVRFAFKHFDKYEKEFNKPAFNFSTEEVENAIIDYIKKNNGIYATIRIAATMSEYAIMFNADGENNWKKYMSLDTIVKLTGEKVVRKNITKQDLLDLFDAHQDPQTFIVPLLIFEGLEFTVKKEVDEVRGLTKGAVSRDSIFIPTTGKLVTGKGSLGRMDRRIEIDEDIYKRIMSAINQTAIIVNARFGEYPAPLQQTEYVLRGIQKNTVEVGPMKYNGLVKRVRSALNIAEREIDGLDYMTVADIANCGKAHYITKYIDEGMSEEAAVIQTLKRFGNWDSNYNILDDTERREAEMSSETNKSRFKRLMKNYKLFL